MSYRTFPDTGADASTSTESGSADAPRELDGADGSVAADAELDAANESVREAAVDAGADANPFDAGLDASVDVARSVDANVVDANEVDAEPDGEADTASVDVLVAPSFAIIEPAPNYQTDDPRVIVTGICDSDVVVTPNPRLTDSDCSDGTWGAAFTIDTELSPFDFGTVVTFEATKMIDGGSTPLRAQLHAFLTEAPLTIDQPTVVRRYVGRLGGVALGGTCAADLTMLTTDVGTFIDSDCSDGRWELASIPFVDGQVRTITVRGERTTSRGALLTASDTIIVARDTTPPAVPAALLSTVSGTNENFPRVQLTPSALPFNPAGFMPSDEGLCVLASDAACSSILISTPCQPGSAAGLGGFLRPFVRDNATVSLHAQTVDLAGNKSACVPIATYTETTLVPRPSVCDVRLSGLVDATTFAAALADLRARASTYAATEDHVTLCLAPDTAAMLPAVVNLDIPNLYIVGERGPGGTTCDFDASAGECAVLFGAPSTSLTAMEGNTTIENIAILGVPLQLSLGGGPVMRELKDVGVATTTFGIVGNFASIGRIENSAFRATDEGDAGVAILLSSGSIAEMTGVRAYGGAVALFAVKSTLLDIRDSGFGARGVVFLTTFESGTYLDRMQNTILEASGPSTLLLFSDFGSNIVPQSGFFRTDGITYFACTRPGGVIAAVRGEVRTNEIPSLVPLTPNTTGFGGPTGPGTFPDPSLVGPCL